MRPVPSLPAWLLVGGLGLAVGCEDAGTVDSKLGSAATGEGLSGGDDGVGGDDGGTTDEDADNDGHPASSDCDDSDPDIHPGAPELCNGVDDDCDDSIDEDAEDAPLWYADTDADGHGDPATETAACEPPSGFIDQSGDCDDTSAAVHPDAAEVCNAVDDDCDGLLDDEDDSWGGADGTTYYADTDDDGHGDPDAPLLACGLPSGHVELGDDCDDTEPAVNPGAAEICNGVDDDCDGLSDDEDSDIDLSTTRPYYRDSDGDGHGDPDQSTESCAPPSGHVIDGDDCNDSNAAISPSATEVCDVGNIDEDCDGLADDDDSSVDPATMVSVVPDADRDGYGDATATPTDWCDPPSGTTWSTDTTDCDDGDAAVNPGATELCDDDDTDEDCDGLSDDADSSADPSTMTDWFPDDDGDSFGDATASAAPACDDPSSSSLAYVDENTDCDDTDASINPAATEVCDAADTDEDCDGLADDDDGSVDLSAATTWYPDADADSYGDADDSGTPACDDPSDATTTYTTDNTDCDDADSVVNPAATEVCDADNTDEDCDGLADDRDSSVDATTLTDWHRDADEDGYGDASATALALCDDPSTSSLSYVDENTDCDDADATVNPGATEVCDAADTDEDCDGLADDNDSSVDASTTSAWYPDADADSYGDAAATATDACDDPSSSSLDYLADNTDCDDTNPAVNPGATEVCDPLDTDEDCDGLADDDDSSVDPSTQQSWLPDADADGYGDASATAVDACEDPSDASLDWTTDDTDCDDTDDAVNPGATEVCNGIDDDCDSSTTETGLVTAFSSTGSATDYSASFGAGSAASPNTVTISGQETVSVCAGTYYLHLNLADDTVLQGIGGTSAVVLDGGSAGRVLTLGDGNTVSGLTVQHGSASSGGCISAADDLVLSELLVQDCEASSRGGGLALTGTDAQLTDSTFDGNAASDSGGALYSIAGSASIEGCTFTDNEADDGGAIAWDRAGALSIVDTSFVDNLATQSGGALHCERLTATSLDISDTSFTTNVTGVSSGGAIYADQCDLELTDTTATSNTASGSGGALAVFDSDLTTDGLDLTSNSASADGGGLFFSSGGFATIDDGTWLGNSAGADGGGMFLESLTTGGVRIRSVDFNANSPDSVTNADAGAAYSYGSNTTVSCGPTGCI
jgi:predicted outer membrane repeat protein